MSDINWNVPRPGELTPPPADLVRQRDGLHRLATYVVGPARYQQTNRFGLRAINGGFGTPEFGDPPTAVAVAGGEIRVAVDGAWRSTPITSMQNAADFIGSVVDLETAAEHDSPPPGDIEADLEIDDLVLEFLANWWAHGTAALEVIRSDAASVDPSIVQLWPGHFDTAIEVGDENRRASFGASPGDQSSDEPYMYVSVWWPDRLAIDESSYWNAQGFVGSRLLYSDLLQEGDPTAAAVEFFRRGRDLLLASREL